MAAGDALAPTLGIHATVRQPAITLGPAALIETWQDDVARYLDIALSTIL